MVISPKFPNGISVLHHQASSIFVYHNISIKITHKKYSPRTKSNLSGMIEMIGKQCDLRDRDEAGNFKLEKQGWA